MESTKKGKVSILDMNATLPMDENGIIQWDQVAFPRINFKSLDDIKYDEPTD